MSEVSSEWEQLMNNSIYKKELIKAQLAEEKDRQTLTSRMTRVVAESKYSEQNAGSPLKRDLVNDIDRAVAEAKVQEIERQKRQADNQANRETIRQTLTKIIMKDSTDEIHALREQRRRIEVQEKRLKALLEIEKSKMIHKGDYHAARTALKQRREEKVKERRQELSTLQKQRQEQEILVKKMVAGLAEPPTEIILGLRAMYTQNVFGNNATNNINGSIDPSLSTSMLLPTISHMDSITSTTNTTTTTSVTKSPSINDSSHKTNDRRTLPGIQLSDLN